MNEALVNNWNSVVKPEDHVYHLGDFCFGNVEKWNWCLEPGRLNGHIHLILGNHDPDRVFREGTLIERFDSIDFQKILVLPEGYKLQWNQYDVGVDNNGYTPVSWAQIKEKMQLAKNEERTRLEAIEKLKVISGKCFNSGLVFKL